MIKDNFVNDPNYGRAFRVCASGEVHFDGEACNCKLTPQVEKHPAADLGIEPPVTMPGSGAYARREDPATSKEAAITVNSAALEVLVVDALRSHPDISIQDVVEITGERYRSISPRFAPLRRKGLIYVSGKKKAVQTGRTVQTWRAA
jgi:hypothetical protein